MDQVPPVPIKGQMFPPVGPLHKRVKTYGVLRRVFETPKPLITHGLTEASKNDRF